LSNCNIALRVGSQLCFHLQARKAPTVVDPIDRAILSHWASAYLNKFSYLQCPVAESSSGKGEHQFRRISWLKMEAELASKM